MSFIYGFKMHHKSKINQPNDMLYYVRINLHLQLRQMVSIYDTEVDYPISKLVGKNWKARRETRKTYIH